MPILLVALFGWRRINARATDNTAIMDTAKMLNQGKPTTEAPPANQANGGVVLMGAKNARR